MSKKSTIVLCITAVVIVVCFAIFLFTTRSDDTASLFNAQTLDDMIDTFGTADSISDDDYYWYGISILGEEGDIIAKCSSNQIKEVTFMYHFRPYEPEWHKLTLSELLELGIPLSDYTPTADELKAAKAYSEKVLSYVREKYGQETRKYSPYDKGIGGNTYKNYMEYYFEANNSEISVALDFDNVTGFLYGDPVVISVQR